MTLVRSSGHKKLCSFLVFKFLCPVYTPTEMVNVLPSYDSLVHTSYGNWMINHSSRTNIVYFWPLIQQDTALGTSYTKTEQLSTRARFYDAKYYIPVPNVSHLKCLLNFSSNLVTKRPPHEKTQSDIQWDHGRWIEIEKVPRTLHRGR